MEHILSTEERIKIIADSDGTANSLISLTEQAVKKHIFNDSFNIVNSEAFNYELTVVKQNNNIELISLNINNFSVKSKISLQKYFKDNILKNLLDKIQTDTKVGNGIYIISGTGLITDMPQVGTVFVKITPIQLMQINSLTDLSYVLQRNIVISTQTGLLREYLDNVNPSLFIKQ